MNQNIKEVFTKKKGYKKTRFGLIPIDWRVVKLGEVSKIKGQYGINAAAVDFDFNLPRYLRITDIDKDGRYNTAKEKSVNEPSMEKYLLEKNDIVFARTGASVGESYLHESGMTNLVFAGFLIRFRIDDSILLPYYLKLFSNSSMYWKWVKVYSMRSGQPGINSTEFCSLQLPIPLLNEQLRIVNCLQLWDKSVLILTKLIKAKQSQKLALSQRLLSGKKRLLGYKGDWSKVKAGEVFKSFTSKGFDEELLSATQDKGMIPRNMLKGRVTMPSGDTKSFKLVEKGDFVISLRSFQGGLEYSYYRGLVSPAYTVLKPKKPINDEFYKQYFKSYEFIGRLAVAVIGIRDGKQISYSDFCVVKIANPSLEEQLAIANVLVAADKEIEILNLKLDKLKDQKKGLMQQLLTGKKRMLLD